MNLSSSQKNLLISRVCSGTIRLKSPPLIIRPPSSELRYIAEEVYEDTLEQALLGGAFTESQLVDYLLEQGLWSEEQENQLKGLPEDIEKLKVGLYESTYRSRERETIRKMLKVAKEKLEELARGRHQCDDLSAEGIALKARVQYLVGISLYTTSGERLFNPDYFWTESNQLLEEAMRAYAELKLDESQIRELSRSDQWRSLWSAREVSSSLFGCSAINMTDEQRYLVNWSQTYDNIYSHPECPGDAIISDDDMLDGWLIIQRRKRDERNKHKEIDGVLGTNEKVRNSQEVFVVAQTKEDVDRIQNLNDPYTKMMLKKRFNKVRKEGLVHEANMPDSKQKIQMELTRLQAEHVRGTK